jgi:Ca2+-binding EF-hand superfamily protein
MRKSTLGLIAGATALAAGAAYAQPAPAPREMTRAAVEQRSAQAFDRLDANHDGKLDEADRGARQKARFDRVDANHDGQVSYAEFSAKHAQRDGARKERMARRGERRADGIGHRGGHRFAMPDFARRAGMIRLADADKDGTITKAEFQAARLQRFDRLDADHDGTVTGDEVKAARDNMRQRWQSRRDDRAS